jgi:DNA-binding HxlR family transcriptional regulator
VKLFKAALWLVCGAGCRLLAGCPLEGRARQTDLTKSGQPAQSRQPAQTLVHRTLPKQLQYMAHRKNASTNSRNREALGDFCGMTYALNLLGGRWKLLILHKLEKQSRRFSELKKTLPHITDRMLTLQLRELEHDGLIVRTVFAEVPARVEYALTASAHALSPTWKGLEAWGNAHRQTAEVA